MLTSFKVNKVTIIIIIHVIYRIDSPKIVNHALTNPYSVYVLYDNTIEIWDRYGILIHTK